MGFIGWIFFFLFIGFIIYFFGGMFILKSRGASGIEMIPNYTFWISLPKKTKVNFLQQCFLIPGNVSSTKMFINKIILMRSTSITKVVLIFGKVERVTNAK